MVIGINTLDPVSGADNADCICCLNRLCGIPEASGIEIRDITLNVESDADFTVQVCLLTV